MKSFTYDDISVVGRVGTPSVLITVRFLWRSGRWPPRNFALPKLLPDSIVAGRGGKYTNRSLNVDTDLVARKKDVSNQASINEDKQPIFTWSWS